MADHSPDTKNYNHMPECSTWHKFLNPGGAISTKKFPISNPGGTILTKNVLFPTQGQGIEFWRNMSYLQPRGHNFNQKCHIAYTRGMTYTRGWHSG